MECLYCKRFFEPKQKYCSPKCRTYHHRRNDNVTDTNKKKEASNASVTDNQWVKIVQAKVQKIEPKGKLGGTGMLCKNHKSTMRVGDNFTCGCIIG